MRLPWPWPSATGRESLSSTALPYLSAYAGFHRLLILNNLFHATSNRTAGHAGDPRHHAHTAITVGAGLSGGKPPPPPLIQNRRQFSVTSSNTGCRPDHPQTLSCCNP